MNPVTAQNLFDELVSEQSRRRVTMNTLREVALQTKRPKDYKAFTAARVAFSRMDMVIDELNAAYDRSMRAKRVAAAR
jgi:hypothetical protein